MARIQRHKVRFDQQRHTVQFGGPGDAIAVSAETFFEVINDAGDLALINDTGDRALIQGA